MPATGRRDDRHLPGLDRDMSRPETPRGKAPEPPYMWASKTALRKIAEKTFMSAWKPKIVYLALCEIASDQASATFEAGFSYIAKRAGICRNSAQAAIKELLEIGVIATRKGGRNEPNKYRILTMKKADDTRAPDALP